MLILQGTEPRATLTVDEGHSVEALAGYSKGFVAGLDGGLVALFDRDEKEYFRRTRTFTIHDHALPVRSAHTVLEGMPCRATTYGSIGWWLPTWQSTVGSCSCLLSSQSSEY